MKKSKGLGGDGSSWIRTTAQEREQQEKRQTCSTIFPGEECGLRRLVNLR